MNVDFTRDLVIERYKFIQEKQKHLDSILSSNVSLLVKVFIGLFSLVFAVLGTYLKQPEVISLSLVTLVFKLSLILLLVVSVIIFLMTISNVIAWLGYRRDEVELLQKFGGDFQREEPKLSNMFAWQETWFLFALIVIIITAASLLLRSSQFIDFFFEVLQQQPQ
ncbi:TPA: hypothetical protein NJ582_004439 [Vibrio parahaemolyticus]|nr:hypothetical protein [Vibrio parahaemolyticus]